MLRRRSRVAGAGLVALDVVVLSESNHDALAYAGGTCGNVLSILSFLNWQSSAVGYLGNDTAGALVIEDLAKAGVNSSHLHRKDDSSTPVFVQQLQRSEGGTPQHTFANSCHSCGQPLGSKSASSTPIHSFADGETPDVFFMDRLSEDILMLAESAKAQGATVFYEPSVKSDRAYWDDAFSLIDIVKYSGDRFAPDELEPHTRRADALWEVQTLGAKGLKYRRHSSRRHESCDWQFSASVNAPRLVDTCGAGDWCSSGLLHYLLSESDSRSDAAFAKALRFGQVLGAWACAFIGARGAMYASELAQTRQAIDALSNGYAVDMTSWPTTANRHTHGSDYCPTGGCSPGRA